MISTGSAKILILRVNILVKQETNNLYSTLLNLLDTWPLHIMAQDIVASSSSFNS